MCCLTCSRRAAVQTVRRDDARVYGGGGVVTEVHHRGRGCGRGLRHDWRLAWWSVRLVLVVVVVVVVGGAGGDTVLRQELFQVHVLQLEGVSVVGQRLVPQRGAQEGRLGGAVLLIQVLLLLLLAESCEGENQSVKST